MARAREQSKPELFRAMLRRALDAGVLAAYLLADAWFGGKENLALALELGLTGIFQMKRGNLAYRFYFKEIKQNLGLWKEQSGRYQVAYASVHLATLRYLLLFEGMLRSGRMSYGEFRDRQSGQILVLTHATLLWQLFRALIEGALGGLVRDPGRTLVRHIIAAIDQSVEEFLTHALQMKPDQVAVQLEAEQLADIVAVNMTGKSHK